MFDAHFEIWLTSEHTAKFSRVPFGDFRMNILTVKNMRVCV